MYISRVSLTFFVCFMYFDPIVSIPVNQSTALELHQITRNNEGYGYITTLEMFLSLASSGRNFFEQLDTPTEDCIRTARVTMNLLSKPSTGPKTYDMIRWSSTKVYFQETASPNPVNILCKYINDAVKLSLFSVPEFEELKNKVELPKPARNYLVAVPEGENLTKFLNKPIRMDDKELFKYLTMRVFLEGDSADNKTQEAILALCRRDDLKSSVESEFSQVHQDYIEELSAQIISSESSLIYGCLAPRLHDYFTNKSAHKEEYKKLIGPVSPKERSWCKSEN